MTRLFGNMDIELVLHKTQRGVEFSILRTNRPDVTLDVPHLRMISMHVQDCINNKGLAYCDPFGYEYGMSLPADIEKATCVKVGGTLVSIPEDRAGNERTGFEVWQIEKYLAKDIKHVDYRLKNQA